MIDADDTDSTTDASGNAASDSASSTAASGMENTGVVSGAENVSDVSNTSASGTVGSDTSENTGAPSAAEKSDMIVLETSAASTEIETTGAATDITDGTAAGSDANVSGGTSTAASGAGITTGGAGAGSTAPGESAVETGAVETTLAESLESIPETTVEETTVPESTEAAKKVKLSFHVVDEDGEDIDEKYADVKVSFDKEGVLTLDDSEKAPVRNIRKLTGTRLFGLLRTYSKNYTYKEATLDGDIIRAIRKTTDEDEHTVYEYTMDGENWTAFEEDSEILLVYCAPETKGSGHAEYIEEGKIKVVVDLKKDLPEGVELRVQEVTDEDQNYDAYMTALDDAAKASASEIEKHSNENTLLYDIAFIGHDEDGQEYEYQPGEDVSVKVSFLGGQLACELGASDADNVVIKHLPVKDEVKENAAKDGQRTTADMTDLSADDIKVEDVKKAKVTLDTEAKIATVDEEEDEDEEKEVAESKDEVTFKTDSFSVWAFTHNDNDFSGVDWTKDFVKLKEKKTIDGKESDLYCFNDKLSEKELEDLGGRGNIKLEYHYITDDSETFTGGNSNKDNDVTGYKADRVLGIAGNFHIVAFGTAHLGAHTNGNILASTLEATGHNFGTNKFGKESSYVYTNYSQVQPASSPDEDDILAVSEKTKVDIQDNGNAFGINNTKLDRPHIVYKDSDAKKFIDIGAVKKEITDISKELAEKKEKDGCGVTVSETEQETIFTINDPDGVAYVNLKPEQVNHLKHKVYFDGFKSGHNGSIIVNVDLSGITTTSGTPFTMPSNALIKIDGVEQNTNEVTEFSAGKIIWNFVNANGQYIKSAPTKMSGTIIALGASVQLCTNINGTIIAENTSNSGETHRSDFTGIIRPTKTGFTAVKKVNDSTPTSEQNYSFNLEELVKNAEDGKVSWKDVESVQNSGSKISFKEITYSKEAEHWYRISEDQTAENGVTKDNSQYLIHVVVTSSNDGNGNTVYSHKDTYYKVKNADELIRDSKINTVAIEQVASEASFEFNNTVTITKKAEAIISATKQVTGAALSADQFEFELKDLEQNKVIDSAKNAANGSINFKKIEYTEAGEHHYIISEKNTGLAGYTYDASEIEVTVNVVADAAGNLTAQVTYSEETPTFTNSYTAPSAEITLTATKIVSGADLKDNQFEFELMNSSKTDTIETVKNKADGTVSFSPIRYTQAGEYKYYIREKNTGLAGYTYDTSEIEVIVNVTADIAGNLTATASYSKTPTFTNSYTAPSAEITLTATKIVSGADLKDNQFEFELMNSSKTDTIETVKNKADGTVSFSPIRYTQAGEYKYYIREKNTGLAGYTYDASEIEVTVNVTADAAGKLTATASYSKTPTFTNSYTAPSAEITLTATKIVKGAELKENQFSFELLNSSKTVVIESTKNAADGTVSFGSRKYMKAGEYKYYIREKNTGLAGYTYDASEIEVTVNVTADEAGKLTATASYSKTPTFTNTYTANGSAVFAAKKVLEGKDLTAGQFSFDLKDKAGKVLETATNAADGTISFAPINYSLADVGTKIYTIHEVEGSEKGYTYDKHVETVTVTIRDKGDGTLDTAVTYDADGAVFTNYTIDFKVNKFERTGTRELDGAKIQIKDSTGAVIAEWLSKSGETHDFGSSLKSGETYTIHEETAPSGYYTISDMNFTVGEKGEITLAGSSDDVKLEDGVIKICDERIKSSGGGGGGNHPHPLPETTPAETTPAETTVPETTPVETTNPGGGHGGPSEEVETDEYGRVRGANRGKNKKGQDGGNVKGANRGKTRTGDESMMSIFGFGFLAAVLVLLGWFGIRFTKRNRR